MQGCDIRDSVPADVARIEQIYTDAFPEEDLRSLVRALLHKTPGVVSLVAARDTAVIGHVAFTSCGVPGDAGSVALLGPLAVAPAWQKGGIGSALVRAGLDRLRAAGVDHVVVLGDPGYYSRFGFEPEQMVAPPFALPAAWRAGWQSITLNDTAPKLCGTLTVPPAWNAPERWAP